ncbi:multidrug ABC transporter ATP-binding protein [Rhodospirillum rubrum]|uniref:ABC transporter ATP-binding protein n=1 Tax=Rhodospirillum rubrum TaxID=1085 RepID=UPI0019032CAE|nr:ABC transporter ATP-binding protein [Rhodospirillum rubrum]MBK1664392.1 multidrug ABC transporter ATP-binding protein [Rhodospirillum rubrum]MBK1677634.1 multidrug ABC transporter ATP-binding protein [Rhodospirillum rubrum]
MIRIDDLSHAYPGRRGKPARLALRDLTLGVAEGSFTILAGPNGSGKSTLFRILCGLCLPSSGRVSIGGHDLLAAPAAARALMSVVFQSPAVDKQLSVAENLALHGRLYGLSGKTLAARRDEALAWSGLESRLGDRVGTLSGGLARQVELAKCLLTYPRVLLLDEPTSGLDPAARRAFLDALTAIQRQRKMTVLMTSHVFSEAEDADKVAILRDGDLLAHDSPAALRRQLGRDMLVVTARDAETLAPRLGQTLGLAVSRHGAEIRIEAIPASGPVPLIDAILSAFRGDIQSIAVRQPTLEDVFIHITGTTASRPRPGSVSAASVEAAQ